MNNWLVDSPETLATRIKPGAKLCVGADYAGVAMELTRALIRGGVGDFHLVCLPGSGLQADLLIGAGRIRTIETAAITLGEYGTPHRFHDALRLGNISILDSTCPAMHAALEAGRKAIPFMPLRGLIGSDLARLRPDWRIIENPFQQGDMIVLLPAIRPDFALMHAPFADRDGNVFIGRRRELATMAQASTGGALITVEEVRDCDLMAQEETAAGALSALYVAGIAVAPSGAWPLGLWDRYQIDDGHLQVYDQLARTAEGFTTYLDRYVFGTKVPATATAREHAEQAV